MDGAAANLLVEIQETEPALPGDHNLYHNAEDCCSRYYQQCGRRWKAVDKNLMQKAKLKAQNKQLIKQLETRQAEAQAALSWDFPPHPS